MSFNNPSKRISIPAFFALTVLLGFLSQPTRAQVKKPNLFLIDERQNSAEETRKQLAAISPVIKLLNQAEEPLAFFWQLNADTLLKAKDVFREVIEFTGDAEIRRAMAADTVSLQKSSAADYDVRRKFLRYSGSVTAYEISQQKGKPILVLEKADLKDKMYFKVFLDKSGKKILKIQRLSNGRFYLPTPFEGPTISL